LPRALHPRDLYRMDLLRLDGAGTVCAAPATCLRAHLSCVGISIPTGDLHSGIVLHRGKPNRLGTAREHDWTGNSCAGSAGVLFVGWQIVNAQKGWTLVAFHKVTK